MNETQSPNKLLRLINNLYSERNNKAFRETTEAKLIDKMDKPNKQELLLKDIGVERKNKSRFELKTSSGYRLDEVVSALQKSIRRCQEKQTLFWGLELWQSGFWKYLLRRLKTISAEDIGLANVEALIMINVFYTSCILEEQDYIKTGKNKKYGPYKPEELQVTEILMYFARAKKSRIVDYVCSVVDFMFKKGEKLEVPLVARDMHTKAGKARMPSGRERNIEFYKNGAEIVNKAKIDGDDEYRKQCYRGNNLSELIDELNPDNY